MFERRYRPIFAALTMLLWPGAASAEPGPNLAGRWAQLQVTTSVVDVPMSGPSEARITSLALLDMEQDDNDLAIQEVVCAVESDGPTKIIRTEYPRGFAKALSGRQRRARLEFSNGAWRYLEPKSYRSSGVELADPEQDELPFASEDPRVVDQDGDGHPGLTVRIAGWVNGEIYMIQRGWSELSGIVRSKAQIEGSVAWSSEQRVLEATSNMLERAPLSRPHPQQEKSFFRMARVPERATCADLEKRAPRLFGIR